MKALVSIVAVVCLGLTLGADWPAFRGPTSDGIAPADAAPPLVWSETENLAWVVDLPGEGWSSPVVVGDRVFVTTAVPVGDESEARAQSEAAGKAAGDSGARIERGSGVYRFEVRCYSLTDGSELWTRVARQAKPTQPKHRDNTFATETVVSDGRTVYAYFGMNGVSAYTLEGELLWEADPGSYPLAQDWGTASCPVLVGGRLVLQIDNEEGSFVVGLDAADGSEVWRVPRDEKTTWCTPCVWRHADREEVVLGGKTVRSYNPADGSELWSMFIGGRSSASATAVGDVLYIGSENRVQRGGTPGGLFAVRAGATGELDVTNPNDSYVIWANPEGSVGISSPLVYEGMIYVPERRGGVLRLHNTETGEKAKRTRLRAGVMWASPLAVGGNILLLDDAGKALVLAPGPDAELLHTSELPGRFWSTPAVAGDSLLIRSLNRLFCIRAD